MKKTRAKGSERPLLSAAKRLRAWYMWARSWNTCFSAGKGGLSLGDAAPSPPQRPPPHGPSVRAGSQGPPLTGVDQADGREGVQAQTLGRLDLLEAAGQATQEVLALLAEAQPQVELHLGLHRPAHGAEAPLPGQLGVGAGSAWSVWAGRDRAAPPPPACHSLPVLSALSTCSLQAPLPQLRFARPGLGAAPSPVVGTNS